MFNFTIKAIHIPGIENVVPDTISRLHEPNQWQKLGNILNNSGIYLLPNNLRFHMSKGSISLLIFQILNWLGWKVN